MTTPIPTDEQIAEELTSALLTEAARVTPEPALHKILARAHEAGPTRKIRRRGGWVPVLTGAVAAGGLVAAAIVIFAPGGEQSTTPEPAVSCAEQVQAGCDVDLAVWYLRPPTDELVSIGITVDSTGDIGLDAVRALLDGESMGNLENPWHRTTVEGNNYNQPIAEVNAVIHTDGMVTVDFDRQLTSDFASLEGGGTGFGKPLIQQLVLTVQSALRTDDPVLITVNDEPATEAFGEPLSGPIQADWSQVSGIRLDRPAQRMVVQSPFAITGESSTNEGNVLWEVSQDGVVVDERFTTGGSIDGYAPFEIRLDLEPGSYTVKLWEPNVASGAEAWADEMSVVYVDILVE